MSEENKVLNVAVLLGGTSAERPVSKKSGQAVIDALDPLAYKVTPFDPRDDIPKLVSQADEIDVALVMLHGRGGEDGTIQGLLNLLGIPYQCAGVLGCALAMDKIKSKALFRHAGLPVARDMVLRQNEPYPLDEIADELGIPVVVKPAREGSSFGITIVRDKESLPRALSKAFDLDNEVLVEEFLPGREMTVGVLGNRNPEPLPAIEIIPTEKYDFFDYEAKYQPGASKEVCPAPVIKRVSNELQELAIWAHQVLGLKGYSRTDFILTKEGPRVLETNTIPGMTVTSLLPLAAKTAGISFAALVNRLIALALEA